ncbi:MAG: hypothetical protein QOJ30_2337, partial [Pseudonocardiales bacterium]|nr:hypothetical protein [Pseudonocardiales bacterium]
MGLDGGGQRTELGRVQPERDEHLDGLRGEGLDQRP